MKAIAVVPGTKNVSLVDRPEPSVTAPDEVKLKILRVGICGTDREQASGGRALTPHGQRDLVIGHENFGRVVEVGSKVTRVKVGDLAAITVRRGCGGCLSCTIGRSDMCTTGDYHERGIWGLDGYQAEYVVDKQDYVVPMRPEIEATGVLAEPLTIAEKAIDVAVTLQKARLPDAAATPNWLSGRRCLVAGLGPVGLLAALALRLRGADVYGLDVVDPSSARPVWLNQIGGTYVNGRKTDPKQILTEEGPMELIFEATGVPTLEFNLVESLAECGIYVLTGIPGGDRMIQIAGADIISGMVLQNQLMVGSVNAARDHWEYAVEDLYQAHLRWPGHASSLITHRRPYDDFETVLRQHPDDEIKAVIEWPD